MTEQPDKKPYLYLPGGNPVEGFTSAAKVITKRAMPFIGRYNDLYDRNNQHGQTIARGLSADYGVPITPEQLVYAHGVKHALALSAKCLDAICITITSLAMKQGKLPPDFVLLHRTPGYLPVIDQFKSDYYRLAGVASFDICHEALDDGTSCGSFNRFKRELYEEVSRAALSIIKEPKKGVRPTYVIGFFDVNPCNPTGSVRGEAEIKATADVLELIREANALYLRREMGISLTGANSGLEFFRVIEDHIYRGLEYEGAEKPYSFRQIDSFAAVTHTVLGVAKYGLVGMRSGLVVAPPHDAKYMFQCFEGHNSDIAPHAVLAAEYMFGDNPDDMAQRESYLQAMRARYQTSAHIAYAAINGKGRDFLSAEEYDTAVGWFKKHGGLKTTEAQTLLEDGIQGLSVRVLPQSGFFLLVDYEDMFVMHDHEESYDGEEINKLIRQTAEEKHRLGLGYPEYTMHDEQVPVFRMTVAVKPADLVTGLLRLNEWAKDVQSMQPFLNTNYGLQTRVGLDGPQRPNEEEIIAQAVGGRFVRLRVALGAPESE